MLSQHDGGSDTDVWGLEALASGPGGVQSWNVPPCGPGDFVGGFERGGGVDECMCALLQSAEKAHVEVNTASGPYINHHMSSSLNKMYSLLCFAWTLNGNKLL